MPRSLARTKFASSPQSPTVRVALPHDVEDRAAGTPWFNQRPGPKYESQTESNDQDSYRQRRGRQPRLPVASGPPLTGNLGYPGNVSPCRHERSVLVPKRPAQSHCERFAQPQRGSHRRQRSRVASFGVPIEEIAALAGHSTTRITELVYRKELKPVLRTGATVMGELLAVRQ